MFKNTNAKQVAQPVLMIKQGVRIRDMEMAAGAVTDPNHRPHCTPRPVGLVVSAPERWPKRMT